MGVKGTWLNTSSWCNSCNDESFLLGLMSSLLEVVYSLASPWPKTSLEMEQKDSLLFLPLQTHKNDSWFHLWSWQESPCDLCVYVVCSFIDMLDLQEPFSSVRLTSLTFRASFQVLIRSHIFSLNICWCLLLIFQAHFTILNSWFITNWGESCLKYYMMLW